MSNPLVFKYELDGRVILFEGRVFVDLGNEIMIQYDTKLDGVYMNSLEKRKIQNSDKEATYRMRVAASMFAALKKVCAEQKKDKKKSVSFAKHKMVQDFIGEYKNQFFSSLFADSDGYLLGDKYTVPLDTKVIMR